MTLIVPNAGEVILLDAATGKTPATTWTLRLYTVIASGLSRNTVTEDLTEAVGGDYVGVPLDVASWVTTPGSPTTTTYPKRSFVFTGPLTTHPVVIGYYITREDGSLVYAEPLAIGFVPANPGDTLDVTPILTLGSVAGD